MATSTDFEHQLYGTYLRGSHDSVSHYIIPHGGSVVPTQICEFFRISLLSVDPSDFDDLRSKLACMQSGESLEVLLFRQGQ